MSNASHNTGRQCLLAELGCKKDGICICQGCKESFCSTHWDEHRKSLHQEFEQLIYNFDVLNDETTRYYSDENLSNEVAKKIANWEDESIQKIRYHAENLRSRIRISANDNKDIFLEKIRNLGISLKKARTQDDFLEYHINEWKQSIEKVQQEIAQSRKHIQLLENKQNALIHCLEVSNVDQSKSTVINRFSGHAGGLKTRDDSLYALNSIRGSGYIWTEPDYIYGVHRIRFRMKKASQSFITSFNIISGSSLKDTNVADIGQSLYGWSSADRFHPSDASVNPPKITDLEGRNLLNIELTIDCEEREIRYFNEDSMITRSAKVNLTKCPFPWKIIFYVYDKNDSVELLPLV